MAEISKINGYDIKDATAREEIEELKKNGVGGGGGGSIDPDALKDFVTEGALSKTLESYAKTEYCLMEEDLPVMSVRDGVLVSNGIMNVEGDFVSQDELEAVIAEIEELKEGDFISQDELEAVIAEIEELKEGDFVSQDELNEAVEGLNERIDNIGVGGGASDLNIENGKGENAVQQKSNLQNNAKGKGAFAANSGQNVNGVNSSAFGQGNTVNGNVCFVAGKENTVRENSPLNSVFGLKHDVQGEYNLVAGYGCTTTMDVTYSVVAGMMCSTEFNTTCLIGNRLKAGINGQTAFGRWNEGKPANAFEIGWGDRTKRANIFEVLRDGRAKVYGAPTEANDVARMPTLNSAGVLCF